MPQVESLIAQPVTPEIPWQVVVGVLVLTTFAIIQLRRRTARRMTDARTAVRSRRRLPTTELDGDLHKLTSQIEQLAREVTAQVDTRFHKLAVLLREADERINRLQRVSESASGGPAGLDLTVGDAGIEDRADAAVPATAARDNRRRAAAYAAQGLSTDDIAARLACSVSEVDLLLHLDRPIVPAPDGLGRSHPNEA